MDFSQLRAGETAAAIGGIVLVLALFLPAYSPNTENPNAMVAGGRTDASLWQANHTLRFVLLLAAVAPVVLVYIIARGHQLSWPRGELTAVIGLVATTLLFYVGIIDRPGEPSGQVGLAVGWFLAFVAALAVAAGGAIRSSEHERTRKPPGVV
jgi:hypothetical protein